MILYTPDIAAPETKWLGFMTSTVPPGADGKVFAGLHVFEPGVDGARSKARVAFESPEGTDIDFFEAYPTAE